MITAEPLGDCHRVRWSYSSMGASFNVALMADLHLDSKLCDRNLLRRHLEKARDTGAAVMIFGDIFDAMGGPGDRRRTHRDVDQSDRDDYYNSLLDIAENVLGPYRENIALLSPGNHEASVLKHHGIDLMPLLAQRLQRADGSTPAVGGYDGYVALTMIRGEKKTTKGVHSTRWLYYHHGGGAGGVVTRGVIGTNRRAVYIDADIIATGHIHEAWHVVTKRDGVSMAGVRYQRPQHHVQLATYKREFGLGGYHSQKERPPKPQGCAWLVLTPRERGSVVDITVTVDVV